MNTLPDHAKFSKPRRSHSQRHSIIHPHQADSILQKVNPNRRVKSSGQNRGTRLKLFIAGVVTLLPLLWGVNNSSAFSDYSPVESFWSQVYPLAEKWMSDPVIPVLEASPPSPWLQVSVNPGEDWSQLFEKYGLNPQQLPKLLSISAFSDQLKQLSAEQELLILRDQAGNLQKLILALPFGKELYIRAESQNLVGEIRPRQIQVMSVHRHVTQSLWETVQQTGLSSYWWSKLVKIFRWNIDLVLNSQPGDQFTVIYEQHLLGEAMKPEGEILAAEYVHQGNIYRAIRYTDKTGMTAYYTPAGENLRKTFLLTPVDFTKVSSHFGLRKHPIFHKMRIHTGIDYAAPRGTPVTAAGNAKVVFIGWKGGYGKTVMLEHGERYRTLYGHLSKYAKGLEVGQTVTQEQVIGYVGQTGWATAPHLHYEFYVDGVYQNPQQANLPISMPIAQAYQADFLEHAKTIMTQLDALSPVKTTAESVVVSKPLFEQVALVKTTAMKSSTEMKWVPPTSMLQQQSVVSKEWQPAKMGGAERRE